MEEDKIKDLFQDFQPRLSSDTLFLSGLKKHMEAVALVKRHAAAARRRNRIAVAVAALSGFVAGVIFTLLMPLLGDRASALKFSLPSIGIPSVTFDSQIITWTIMAALSVTIAVNAYEITLSRLSAKQKGLITIK